MEATEPKITLVGLPDVDGYVDGAGSYLRLKSVHPCEHCKCCSCKLVCTMCNRNCSPSDGCFVPVIGCPDFINMQETPPVRYTYRAGYDLECRLHLPGLR